MATLTLELKGLTLGDTAWAKGRDYHLRTLRQGEWEVTTTFARML